MLACRVLDGLDYVRGAGVLEAVGNGRDISRSEVFLKRTMLRNLILCGLKSGLADL